MATSVAKNEPFRGFFCCCGKTLRLRSGAHGYPELEGSERVVGNSDITPFWAYFRVDGDTVPVDECLPLSRRSTVCGSIPRVTFTSAAAVSGCRKITSFFINQRQQLHFKSKAP